MKTLLLTLFAALLLPLPDEQVQEIFANSN